ncbi:Protein BOLA1 [Hirschfeldia incana]|nr:Protein BOLA1 [Hirschfeldia incana]
MFSSSIRLIVSSGLHLKSPVNPPRLFTSSVPRFFFHSTPTGYSDSRITTMSSVDDKTGSNSGGAIESRASRMREKLEKELEPVELVIEDVSYQHAGHAGMKGRGTDEETHFNVKIVSKGFEGMNLVKRRRLVYDLLREELDSGLHALSIVSKTPSESTTR